MSDPFILDTELNHADLLHSGLLGVILFGTLHNLKWHKTLPLKSSMRIDINISF